MSRALMRLRPGRRITLANTPPVGDFEYLRPVVGIDNDPVVLPQATAWGPGITFSAVDGKYHGTAVDTTEPPWAFTVTPSYSGDNADNLAQVQSAINTAASSMTGDTKIVLQKRTVALYTGALVFPVNNTGFKYGLIVIDADDNLPTQSPGHDSSLGDSSSRISPSDYDNMAEIWSTIGAEPTISTAPAARGVFVRGVFFSNRAAVLKYNMIFISPNGTGADITLSASYPENIIFSQCGWDGANYVVRALWMSGRGLACVDSYGDNIGFNAGQDTQFYWTNPNGEGPHKLHNTWSSVDGNCENYMTGGAGLQGPDGALLVGDIEVTQNYMTSPDPGIAHKNKIEHKAGVRALYEGNKFGFQNAGAQPGTILIRLTDQEGANPYVDTHDVVIANNYVQGGIGGINVVGFIFGAEVNLFETRRVCSVNNLVYQPSSSFTANCYSGWAGRVTYVSAFHNTFIGPVGAFDFPRNVYMVAVDPPANDNMRMDQNVMTFTTDTPGYQSYLKISLVDGTGPNIGEPMWANQFGTATSTCVENLMNYDPADPFNLYPNNLLAGDDIANMGFVDYDAGNYALTPASIGYQAVNGHDVGFNKPLFDSIQSRVST
jgi:hypothetical protein